MALISKASLLMVPSTYEPGTLFNVLPSGNRAPDNKGGAGYDQTRADFDFDRGSNAAATRINSSGLIEKYRENLFTESNNFSDSDWNVKAGTFTQGVEDPNGGNEAWSWTATNTDPYLYQSPKTTNGVSVLSIWVKGVGSTIGTSFQIRTGAAPYNNLTLTGEWQRVEHFNTNASGTSVGFEYGNPAVAGDVVHIYAAQYEVGTIATDYLDSTSVTGKAGVLVDLPRINYDANGENGSLLLEPSRANFVSQSEYIDSWSKTNVSVITNQTTSPEGLQNAQKIRATGTGQHYIQSATYSFVSSTDYTYSVFAKKSNTSLIQIIAPSGVFGSNAFASYNFDTLEVTEGSAATASMEDYGSGWYRLILKCTSTSAGSASSFYVVFTNDKLVRIPSFTANNEEAFVFGAQLEAGSYVSSYIPNHGESGGVTRAADSCSVTGASDVIGQTEGTIFAEFDSSQFLTGSYIGISDGNATHRQIFGWEAQSGDSGTLRLYGFWNGFAYSSFSKGQKIKVALAYKNNDFALYVNGTQAGTKTSGTISGTLSQFGFNSGGGSQKYQGNAYQLALFKERLTNAELATLTTL